MNTIQRNGCQWREQDAGGGIQTLVVVAFAPDAEMADFSHRIVANVFYASNITNILDMFHQISLLCIAKGHQTSLKGSKSLQCQQQSPTI